MVEAENIGLSDIPQPPLELDCWVLEYTFTGEDYEGDPNWKIEGVYLRYEDAEAAEDELREQVDSVERTRHGSRDSPTTIHIPAKDKATWSVPVFSRGDVFDAYANVRQDAVTKTDGFRAGMEAGAKQIKEQLLGNIQNE